MVFHVCLRLLIQGKKVNQGIFKKILIISLFNLFEMSLKTFVNVLRRRTSECKEVKDCGRRDSPEGLFSSLNLSSQPPRRRNKENSPLSLDDCEGGDDDDAHNDADAVDLWEGGGQWFRMQSGSTDLHCNPSR